MAYQTHRTSMHTIACNLQPTATTLMYLNGAFVLIYLLAHNKCIPSWLFSKSIRSHWQHSYTKSNMVCFRCSGTIAKLLKIFSMGNLFVELRLENETNKPNMFNWQVNENCWWRRNFLCAYVPYIIDHFSHNTIKFSPKFYATHAK